MKNWIKKIFLVVGLLSVLIPSVSFALNFGEYIGAGSATTKLLLHLNGNSTDSSGNGNNGTDTNITYGLGYGKLGQGASFNGSSSKIVFGDVLDFEYNKAFSISIWFKTSSAGYGALVAKQSNTTGNGYAIYVNPSSKIEVQLNGGSSATVFGNTNVADGNWHNVLVVKTTSTNIEDVKIYLDGENDTASSSGTLTATISNAITFAIGCRDSVNLFFNGYIDEPFVENRAWSAEEIKKRYTFAKGRFVNN